MPGAPCSSVGASTRPSARSLASVARVDWAAAGHTSRGHLRVDGRHELVDGRRAAGRARPAAAAPGRRGGRGRSRGRRPGPRSAPGRARSRARWARGRAPAAATPGRRRRRPRDGSPPTCRGRARGRRPARRRTPAGRPGGRRCGPGVGTTPIVVPGQRQPLPRLEHPAARARRPRRCRRRPARRSAPPHGSAASAWSPWWWVTRTATHSGVPGGEGRLHRRQVRRRRPGRGRPARPARCRARRRRRCWCRRGVMPADWARAPG